MGTTPLSVPRDSVRKVVINTAIGKRVETVETEMGIGGVRRLSITASVDRGSVPW